MGAAASAKKEAKKRELLENPLVNGVQEGARLFRLLRQCLKKNPRVKRLVKTKATERGLPQPSSGGAGREMVKLRVPRAGKVVHRERGWGLSSRSVCDGEHTGTARKEMQK